MSEPNTPPYDTVRIARKCPQISHTLLMVKVPPAMSSIVNLLSLA
jgi:hypothetical protein